MTALPPPAHPVLARVREARTALGSVAEVQPVYLPTGVKAEALRDLAALEGQVAELKLRVLAASGDLAEEVAARDAGAWLAHTTRIDHRHARAELRLAEALDQHPATATALAHGTLNLPQARVILTAVDKLPAEHRHRAEDHLIQLATQHGPADLRVLGERILEVVAPEVAEAALAEALEREERRAFQRQSVRIKPLGEGITRITALVPDAVAGRLTTYLDAFTSPRKDDQTLVGEEDRIPLHRRRAHAFCALLEHLDPAELPDHGGDATTLVVTMTLDALRTGLATASLDNGELITAGTARRLACTASIIPAVLGGKGEILDLGRARRLYTRAQRKAMALRDRHCRAEGCTIPAAWCEAHHLIPWSQGGTTDLAHGTLFCSFHHHRAHDTRSTMTRLPNGDFRFHRRT